MATSLSPELPLFPSSSNFQSSTTITTTSQPLYFYPEVQVCHTGRSRCWWGTHPLSSDVSSIICPSLAYANTLYFKSAYNVQVILDGNEPEERLLNRFRREVMRAGVILESKRRRFFENKQDEKKRKTREAAKRNTRSNCPMSRTMLENKKKDDDDGDNWEVSEGGIPQ